MNQNQIAYDQGMRFRLEIAAANLMRSMPEFAPNMAQARARRRALRELGYVVTIFSVTEDGGLVVPR